MALAEPTRDTVWDHYPDLRAVQAAFNQTIASRRGRIVLIAGSPASGRTGFARALPDRLAAHPARPVVVAGSFTPSGGWQPWPPPDPTRLLASAQVGLELAANVLQFSGSLGVPVVGAVGTLLGQLAGASSAVWTLLSRHADRRQPLDGQDQDDPSVLRGALRAAAREGPVVCVLDHLDRAPATARWWSDLLLRLASELDGLPLLLVATMDGPAVLGDPELGEPTGLWAARRLVNARVGRWLPMRRLEVDAVAAWLGRCEPEIATQLWEVTGGEPHWLGLLWEAWREDGTVRRDQTGRWVLVADMEGRAALDIAHDLVWERIRRCYGSLVDDQLDRVRRTLAVGALEGRQFTAQAVAAVADRDPDALIDEFDEHLLISKDHPEGLLEEAGFVELADPRATPGGEGEGRWLSRYRFASELHWRTVRRHGFLSEVERRAGCRALATALEQALQPEPERAAAQIASLLREAGDYQAAASWQTKAELGTAVQLVGARARLLLAQDTNGWDRFDHAQAARQLEHAVSVLLNHWPAGALLEVAEGWVRAAQAAGWRLEHALALRTCGLLHERRGETDAAISSYRWARREAAAAGEPRLAARAMADRAYLELERGRVRLARRRAEAARQLAHRHHAPDSEVGALQVLAAAAARLGDRQGALAAAQAGVVLAEDVGDLLRLSMLLQNLVEAQRELGWDEQARATAERALDAARQVGVRALEAGAELRLADLWVAVDRAVWETHLLRALMIARQLEERGLEAQCRVRLAALAYRQGGLRAARVELLLATRLADEIGHPAVKAEVWEAWVRLAEVQGLAAGRIAILWAVVAYHGDQAGHALATSRWEAAERALADAGEPGGRASLAARAAAVLAHDNGWGLLEELFGPFDTDDAVASDQVRSDE